MIGTWLVLVLLAWTVAGCSGVEWSELGTARPDDEPRLADRSERPSKRPSRQARDGLRITARSNTEVARLSPDDVVRIMRRVGFSDDQILALGTDLYGALSLSGGADLYNGKRLEMIFAVHNQQVHIQSRLRGTFVYDAVIGQFVLGSASSDRGR
jgi:hypothetical protein